MRRYLVGRPKSDEWLDDEPSVTASQVVEPEDVPRATGVLDVRGNMIYAVDNRAPIGFRLKS